MGSVQGVITGGSDTRKRQEGDTVPVPLRSCPSGKSCDGLSVSLAASDTDERAIVCESGTCSAGVTDSYVPAKDLVRGREKEEGQGFLRLRGGAGGDSDDESVCSQDLTLTKGGEIYLEGSAKEVPMAIQDLHTTGGKEEERKGREKERDRDRAGRTCKRGGPRTRQRIEPDSEDDPPEEKDDSGNEERSRSLIRNPKERGTEVIEVKANRRSLSLDRLEKLKKGRGRPIITGEYAGLKEAQVLLNEELGREIKLMHEKKVMSLTGREMLETLKIDPEKYKTEAEHQPTADIFNKLREAQMHIIQVQKSSGNLKGGQQNALKVNATLTLGYIEALRTRMDGNGSQEMETLQRKQREQEELLRRMEERMRKEEERMEEMRATVEQALLAADTEKRKAEQYLGLLEKMSRQKEELERRLQLALEEQRLSWSPNPHRSLWR